MKQDFPGQLRQIALDYLRQYGESPTSDIGNAYFPPNGGASNPGTLAATAVLRKLEREGVVVSHVKHGRTWMRTYWRMATYSDTNEQRP